VKFNSIFLHSYREVINKKPLKKARQMIMIKTVEEKLNESPPALANKYQMKNRVRKTIELVINQVEICLAFIFGVLYNEMEMKKI
jgi:hypothetical protein